uniref:Uncharacterized protein n=1 Tax=Triticum urartu TaxID=4572 RepID=A0A8R7UIB9_TRIUA
MGMQYFQDPPRARSYSHNAYYLARGQHLRDLPRAGSHFCNTCKFPLPHNAFMFTRLFINF